MFFKGTAFLPFEIRPTQVLSSYLCDQRKFWTFFTYNVSLEFLYIVLVCSKIKFFCPIGHHLNNKLSMPKESNDYQYQNTESDPNSHNSQFRIEARLQVWWFFVCYDLGILLKDCLSWILSLFTPWFCKYDVILVISIGRILKNWKICPKKVCNTCAWKEQKKNQKLCVCRRCFCVINKPKMKFLSLLNTFLLLFNEKKAKQKKYLCDQIHP